MLPDDQYKHCASYLESRYYGICTHFREGYMVVTAYAIFDLLRYVIVTDPSYLFCTEIIKLSEIIGFKLPKSPSDVNSWTRDYVNLDSITADIKEQYIRYKNLQRK
jgi:hypothetical protein